MQLGRRGDGTRRFVFAILLCRLERERGESWRPFEWCSQYEPFRWRTVVVCVWIIDDEGTSFFVSGQQHDKHSSRRWILSNGLYRYYRSCAAIWRERAVSLLKFPPCRSEDSRESCIVWNIPCSDDWAGLVLNLFTCLAGRTLFVACSMVEKASWPTNRIFFRNISAVRIVAAFSESCVTSVCAVLE